MTDPTVHIQANEPDQIMATDTIRRSKQSKSLVLFTRRTLLLLWMFLSICHLSHEMLPPESSLHLFEALLRDISGNHCPLFMLLTRNLNHGAACILCGVRWTKIWRNLHPIHYHWIFMVWTKLYSWWLLSCLLSLDSSVLLLKLYRSRRKAQFLMKLMSACSLEFYDRD